MRKHYKDKTRVRGKFLFTPLIIENTWIWLEYVKINQRLQYDAKGKGYWTNINLAK
jgi:hypothetical protein